jgi:hypothetical protein
MASANDTSHCIYRIVCFVTGKCYVGQTNDPITRKRGHFGILKRGKHHSPYLQNAYNLYGKGKFFFEILEEGIPQSEINSREIAWISHYDSHNNGYNMTLGGHDSTGTRRECSWEGITYPSVKDAAKGAGVALITMHRRLKAGYTCDADVTKKAKPVTWNGIEYVSIAEAAKSSGVSHSALTGRLKRGHTCESDVGIETPTIWNGIEYPSMTAAGKSIGFSEARLLSWIRRGCRSDADIQAARRPKTIWNGIEYPSISAAAKAINVPPYILGDRIKRGWASDADAEREAGKTWFRQYKRKIE